MGQIPLCCPSCGKKAVKEKRFLYKNLLSDVRPSWQIMVKLFFWDTRWFVSRVSVCMNHWQYVCVCVCACVRAHACMCVFMLLCVYDVSSHWYLAIICFPYLVGEQQTTSPSDLATAAAKPKQVVTCHCTLYQVAVFLPQWSPCGCVWSSSTGRCLMQCC